MPVIEARVREFDRLPDAPVVGDAWMKANASVVAGNGIVAVFRLTDVVGVDLATGTVRWQLPEAARSGRIARSAVIEDRFRAGCRLCWRYSDPQIAQNKDLMVSIFEAADSEPGIRCLRLTDGHVCWEVLISELPGPSGPLSFVTGFEPDNEECVVDAHLLDDRVVVTLHYSSPGCAGIVQLFGLDTRTGVMVWALETASAWHHFRQQDFEGWWVSGDELCLLRTKDGAVRRTPLNPALEYGQPRALGQDVYLAWNDRKEQGVMRLGPTGSIEDRFSWRRRGCTFGCVYSTDIGSYWSDDRAVRPLDHGRDWEYRPGHFVYGVEAVAGGDLWVLSDGDGGSLDRVDPVAGTLIDRFRPPRWGVGSYQALRSKGVLMVGVLKTRDEQSRDMVIVNMRSGEKSFVGRGGVPVGKNDRGEHALVWLLDRPEGVGLGTLVLKVGRA